MGSVVCVVSGGPYMEEPTTDTLFGMLPMDPVNMKLPGFINSVLGCPKAAFTAISLIAFLKMIVLSVPYARLAEETVVPAYADSVATPLKTDTIRATKTTPATPAPLSATDLPMSAVVNEAEALVKRLLFTEMAASVTTLASPTPPKLSIIQTNLYGRANISTITEPPPAKAFAVIR